MTQITRSKDCVECWQDCNNPSCQRHHIDPGPTHRWADASSAPKDYDEMPVMSDETKEWLWNMLRDSLNDEHKHAAAVLLGVDN